MPRKKKLGRARNGTGCVDYYKPRDCWRVRFTVPDPLTGKAKQKARYFATKVDAEQALYAITHSIADESYTEPNKQTLESWLKSWLESFSKAQPSTLKGYKCDVKNHISPALGKVKLCDLNYDKIQRFENSLEEKGLSRKTIKNVIGTLSAALKKAVKDKLIPENYAKGIDLPLVVDDGAEVPALTDDQAAALIEASKGTPLEHPIFIALWTGLRISEVYGLRWESIDYENRCATIYQLANKLKGSERTIKAPKNRKVRMIALPQSVIDRLQLVEVEQKKARLKAGSGWSNELGLVFTNPIGTPVAQTTTQHRFRKLCEKAGLPDNITFHSLRHTFVNSAERARIDDMSLASTVGHYSADFSRKRYGSFNKDMIRETGEKLEAEYQRQQKAQSAT